MTDDKLSQYVVGFNEEYDTILTKLKIHLFKKQMINAKSKWAFTKYAILRLLYDHAKDVIKGFKYTPEQLVELIEYHKKLQSKFKKELKNLAESKKEVTEEILKNIDFNEGEEDEEE